MVRSLFAMLLVSVACTFSAAWAAPSTGEMNTPLVEMQLTIEKLVDVVGAYPGDANRKTRRSKLYDIIEPHFDFSEMAKRSLGAHWNTIDSTQQKEFVDLFSKLLARTYLDKIEGIKKDIVKFKGEQVEGGRAIVKTTVENKGDIFPIDYKLLKRDSGWHVYDVVIENIGLVSNYRNEFSGIIRKDKFTGLLEKLRKKVDEA